MNKKKKELELYTQEQHELLEKHIEEHFGEINNYYQETDPKMYVLTYTLYRLLLKRDFIPSSPWEWARTK